MKENTFAPAPFFRPFLAAVAFPALLLAAACGPSETSTSGSPGGAGGTGAAGGAGAAGGSGGGGAGGTGASGGAGGAGGGACVHPAPQGAPIEAAPGAFTWVPFEDAFCANGEPTGIGVSPAPGGADRLFIYLVGGGACWSHETCYDQPIAANVSEGFGEAEFASAGVSSWWYFDRGAADNPFANDHLVVVPYCTGDVHGGTKVTDHEGKPTAHVGALNMAAYLKRLGATFPDVAHVVVAGGSAGGIGAALNWHRVKDAFPCARVDMIDDAAVLLPPPYLQEGLEQTWRAAWGLDAGLPADCAACAADLHAIYPYSAAKSADGRGAVMHGTLDSVVSFYFGISQAQVAEGLAALATGTIDPTPNMRYYYVAGDHHGVFSPAFAQNGVPVPGWIQQMLAGDPAWQSVAPVPGECADSGVCQDCQSCALAGPCAPEVSACQAEPECPALFTCVEGCAAGDTGCVQGCIDQHQAGFDEATSLVECVNQDVCAGLCD